jgi:rSAM/selenodomain-associated transferase 1
VKKLLVVMAKAPVPGQVKTRLQPRFSPADAADLYRCFLEDRLRDVASIPEIDRAVAFAPATAADRFASLAPEGFLLFPQRGRDLGEKLESLFSTTLALGYGAVVVTDSDSPDLPRSFLGDAFALLAGGSDVVFGPCRDGGYYLVGMKTSTPGFFANIPWSTSRVLERSLAVADRLGLKAGILPPWQDIDTFEDLRAFYDRCTGAVPGEDARGRKTLSFLEKLAEAGAFPEAVS